MDVGPLGARRRCAARRDLKVQVVTEEPVPAPVKKGQQVGKIVVNAPGMDEQQLKTLVDKAHIVCPYSNATRNNIDVRLHVTT